MKKSTLLIRSLLVVLLFLAVVGVTATTVRAGEEYSFKVHNTTSSNITKILVSEDKKEWGAFSVGKGIGPGENGTLVWDQSTNNEECKQYVKAVFEDGSETEPAKFDFCAKGLEIEF